MSQVENFTNYGKAFQSKTIVCLIKDKLFIQQILDILEISLLTNLQKRKKISELISSASNKKDIN